MRINIYAQELTGDIERVTKLGTDKDGKAAQFHGVRLYFHSPEELHHTREDDDRSAVTIWLPQSLGRRVDLAVALRAMAAWAEGSWPGGWAGWQDGPEELAVKIGREKDAQELTRAGAEAADRAERYWADRASTPERPTAPRPRPGGSAVEGGRRLS